MNLRKTLEDGKTSHVDRLGKLVLFKFSYDQMIHRFKAISYIKIPMLFFTELEKNHKTNMETQMTLNSQSNCQ
jgi:hypothetical protein